MMNIASAMDTVDRILKKEFKYLYKQQHISIDELHLTFKMDSITHSLQMTFSFDCDFMDVLAFISPTVLQQEDKRYFEALRAINYINWNAKAWGRFYIDDGYDIAYSLRLKYDALEAMPHRCAQEIECAVDYYADLFTPIIDVCQGRLSYEDMKEHIDDIWGKYPL